MPFDLTFGAAAWMAAALIGAGFVRGYSGFGFSALVVASAGLVTNPLHAVAMALILEVLLSGQAWKGVARDVDWPMLRWIMAGAVIGLPLGLWALTALSEAQARAVISVYILLISGVLLLGWRMRQLGSPLHHFAAGVISGAANAPGMGGLPVAAYLAAQPIPARRFRASLVAYFPLLDIYSAPLYWWSGLVSRDTFIATAWAIPLAFLGNWLGGIYFSRKDPGDFRKFAIGLLAALALGGLVKSLSG